MGGFIGTVILTVILSTFWSTEASSPVVLWTLKRIGEGHVESNLNEFSSTQFADLVAWKSEHGNIPVIAFGLNSLSLEDLTPQGSLGSSEPFRKLRRITDASAETLLFPSVESASDSISVLQRKGFEVVQINAGDPLPKIENPSTILVVMDKQSVSMDDEILRVFSKYTLDFPNLVGMLWGKQSTWSEEPEEVNEVLTRRKRQADDNSKLFLLDDKGLLVVFRELLLTVSHQKTERTRYTYTKDNFTGEAETSVGDRTILMLKSTTPSDPAIEQFNLNLTLKKEASGYWTMVNATGTLRGSQTKKSFSFDNVRLSSAVDLTVHGSKSFHCSRFGSLYPTKKMEELGQNHTFTIDINGFQIQAFMSNNAEKFEMEYECVGFFTPGIWSGIFVTIILLSILTWGMKMIMDVRTMDRFDDPKGKPISFGSGE